MLLNPDLVNDQIERFEMREQGSMASWRVYKAAPGDAGMLLVSIYWEDFDGNRSDERARRGRDADTEP